MKKYPNQIIYFLIFLSALPFLFLLTKAGVRGSFSASFANVAGFVGLLLMFWQMLLTNRFLVKYFGPDFVASVNLHMFLGTYGFILIMVHPWLEMLSYGENLGFILLPHFSTNFSRNVLLGQIAFFTYLLVWVSSAIQRNKLSYRWWRYIHYLGYVVIFFVLIHSYKIGTFLRTYPLIRFYWFFLVSSFLVFGIYRAIQFFFSGGRVTYILKDKVKAPGRTTYYKLSPKGKWIKPNAGQFCYLKISKTSESHPFSILDFDEKTKDLIFAVKKTGEYTSEMENMKVGQEVYVDGPYGVFTKEGQNEKPKVIIAGGIGIVPFVDLVKKYGNKDTFMFYANKFIQNAIFRKSFKEKLGSNYIDIISEESVSGKEVVNGHINEKVIKDFVPEKIFNKANFFICGRPGFVQASISSLEKLGIEKKRIFVEEFSF